MEYFIKNLDNTEAAADMENELNKTFPESKAVVDFIQGKIYFKGDNIPTVEQVAKIIHKYDGEARVESNIQAYKYHIKNLDCAHCAATIEDKLKNMDGIENVNLNFTNQTLQLTYDEKQLPQVKELIDKIEPGVIITKEKIEEEEDESDSPLIVSIILSVILVAISYLVPMPQVVKMIVLFAAYIIAGYDILIKLLRNLLNKQLLDENFLMGIATVAAFAIGEHVEAIAIMVFYKIGEYFQDMAVNKSRKSITSLMDIRPDYANIEINGQIEKVDPEDIKIDDVIIIQPGEKIPLDGRIVEGSSYLDTKALTGESKAVEVNVGSKVLSGAINKSGLLKVKVSNTFGDSTVAKILDLVENATANKAPTENFITKFAKYYTPIVVGLAVAVAIIGPLVTGEPFNDWVYRALVFLVISCPCALVLSIPLSFFGGIGNASRHGILIKGANYLEAMNSVDTIAFDKTGTITKGVFEVEQINSTSDYTQEDILEKTAYVQAYSSHPIADSIKKQYGKDLDLSRISDYQDIAGHGVVAKVDGSEVLAGNAKLMGQYHINYQVVDANSTLVYVAIDGKYAGYMLIGDTIKENTKKALEDLKALGFKELIMLSGDNEKTANEVASEVGIDKVYAQLLPDQKVEKLEEIIQGKNGQSKVAYVGDGINDAPVIARADLGFAMGGVGSDAAIEAADVVIMNDDLEKIATTKKIANKTRKIVTQNIVLAMGVKLICLGLGVLGMAAIWEAVIADVGVALVAILNAMRVLNDNHVE